LFRRNPWLIGPVINGISYSPGMSAQPSSDGLGFFFDMPERRALRSFGARPAVGQTHMMGSLLPLAPVTFLRPMARRAFRSCVTRS